MNKAQLRIFSAAITTAALSRKTAIQIELAVGFAVHLECGQAKRLTRATLCEVYSTAGYKAHKPGDLDWKSVNRRIGAALALFDFIGAEEVETWTEGTQKGDTLDAIVAKLAGYKLKSVNEVLEICGKIGPKAPRGERPEPAGTQHIDTKHIHIAIPPTATASELMEAALAIMELAKQATVAQVSGGIAETETETPELETA